MDNRCLEEGAEEFFLKPVQLSDLNKLKPHMMKTKFKNHQQEEGGIGEKPERQGQESAITKFNNQKQEEEKPERQGQESAKTKFNNQKQEEEKPEKEEESVRKEFVSQQTSNSKRKAMEEGISPGRTRPRYNGITTMV